MSLKLNAPGGGSVTLQEPTTASNVTLNLPAETGTVIYSNASGNVGIGVTPSAWGSGGNVEIGNNGIFAGAGSVVNYSANAFFDTEWKYKTTAAASYFRQANGAFNFFIAPSGTAGNAITFTQAMTLDSSGFAGINTIPDGNQRLRVVETGSASRRVADFYLAVASSTGTPAARFVKFDNNTTTSNKFIEFTINQGGIGSGQINANGTGAAAFGSFSDRRVKENIVDLPNQLEKICALRPVEFDYVESYGGGHQVGFVAQEMQEVYPDAVSGDGTEENILSITAWSKTEARLVKAIQEQQAMIEELKAKVAALEAK